VEGSGFLRAAYAYANVAVLVVRGISDLIEGKVAADTQGSQSIGRLARVFALEFSGAPSVVRRRRNRWGFCPAFDLLSRLAHVRTASFCGCPMLGV
jgi:hypothetical protein